MDGFYVTEDGCIMKGCGIESDSHGVFLENDYMRGYYVDPAPLADYTRVWTEDGREGVVNGGLETTTCWSACTPISSPTLSRARRTMCPCARA